jgi:hypothetical protein
MSSPNTKNTTKKKLLEILTKNPDVTTYQELACCSGISRTCFYKRQFNEDPDINDALNKNKINIKMSLKKKWNNSGNFSAELCLFKLNATPEELRALQLRHSEVEENTEKTEYDIREKLYNE